jgi:hypothetical protein
MESSSFHDFDFLFGAWQVRHPRLKDRLVGCHEWQEFAGTMVSRPVMAGWANVDDNVIDLPGDAYRAVTLRSFDPKSKQWTIWWLDGRKPSALDTPLRGMFKDGEGIFYADDTFNGSSIRIRFVWSKITPGSCQWEQAFSPDGGVSWETNWIMEFSRVDPNSEAGADC